MHVHKTSKPGHELAFYLGLNVALVVVIALATYLIWPL
jgi:hypothetical protein